MNDWTEHDTAEAIKRGDLEALRIQADSASAESIRLDRHPRFTALHLAAGAGHIDIVNFLLSSAIGADPCALRGNNFSPLHAAAMFGHTEACKALIDAGAEVNVQTTPQGYAPLHSAAYGGHFATAMMLVAHGANLDLRNYRNERPSDTARRQGKSEVAEALEAEGPH